MTLSKFIIFFAKRKRDCGTVAPTFNALLSLMEEFDPGTLQQCIRERAASAIPGRRHRATPSPMLANVDMEGGGGGSGGSQASSPDSPHLQNQHAAALPTDTDNAAARPAASEPRGGPYSAAPSTGLPARPAAAEQRPVLLPHRPTTSLANITDAAGANNTSSSGGRVLTTSVPTLTPPHPMLHQACHPLPRLVPVSVSVLVLRDCRCCCSHRFTLTYQSSAPAAAGCSRGD